MGVPIMIQARDNELIEHLKKDLKIHKKIDVIRAGLALLEKESLRQKQINRWTQAVKLVASNSASVNKDFQKHSRMKQL